MLFRWCALYILGSLFTVVVHAQLNYIRAFAGTGSPGFSGDTDAPTAAALSGPSGMWMDSNDDIFFADSANHRVRKISAATKTIATVAGSNTTGGFAGDGDFATSAALNAPQGVWSSSFGELFIADTTNCRIRKVSSMSIISTFAGKGCGAFSNNVSAADTFLSSPQAVIGDSSGAIFISDANIKVILMVQSGIITLFAGRIGVTGSFAGEGLAATSAVLNAPSGLWLTRDGALLVADTGHHRVLSISLTDESNTIRTIIGDGTPSWRGDGGPAVSASLNAPQAVCVGADNKLYVTDAGNHRIRIVDNDTGIISTFAGGGGPATGRR